VAPDIETRILSQILLVESVVAQMPNPEGMLQFAVRGLEGIPGVARVWFQEGPPLPDPSRCHGFEIRRDGKTHAVLCFEVTDEALFSPYAPYLNNLACMLGIVLDDHVQRQENERYRTALESLVEARTQALATNRALLNAIVDGTTDAIYVKDRQGRYLLFNQSAANIVGQRAGDVLGKDDTLLFPQHEAEMIMDGDRRVMAGGLVKTYEENLTDAVGRHRIFLSTKGPVCDDGGEVIGLFGIARDITARKLAEEQLAQSEQELEESKALLEGVVENLPFTVFLKEATDLKFVLFNRAGEELVGIGRADVLGKNNLDLFPPDQAEQFSANDREVLDGELGLVDIPEEQILTARKGLRLLHTRKVCLRGADGSTKYLLGISEDITDQKRAAEEHARLQAQLQQIQKMESLGTLAGGIAHDMNNVLGAILGLASANIETQPQASPARRSFETIAMAATRGAEMVRGLLAFARQGQGTEQVLDLNAIIRDEVRLLERTTLSSVRLEMALQIDLHPVRGDASALAHAFMNLCVNAVDAMSGHGVLTLRTRNVDHAWIEAAVEDTGTGMPKDVLDRAMEPFFTTKALGKGTGLGLSTVYSMVQAHRGQIEINSVPGLGTQVKMRFPACAAGTEPNLPENSPLPDEPQHVLKVLLIDDDELIQNAMRPMLQSMGHSVLSSPSGESALAAVESGFRPDVVILDMNMPGLGGGGTLPRLRARLPQVPVLISTGRADQASQDLAALYPLVTLLPKPFTIHELRRNLKQLGW